MAVELVETLKEAITAYTGLSPNTFFSVIAAAIAVYYIISVLFGSNNTPQHRPRSYEEDVQPLPPPVQLGEISEDELKAYDGNDPEKPLLMAIKGQIYDVSQSRYGFFFAVKEVSLLDQGTQGKQSIFQLEQGLSAGLLRQATYTTARLGTFRILTNKALEANDGKPLPLYQKALCRLTARIIWVLVKVLQFLLSYNST